MSRLTSVSVQSFRSHDKKDITLHPQTTVIVGKNGIGKTSLLEAVYAALQGKSFKGTDEELLKHGEKWWRVDVGFDDETTRTVSYNSENKTKQKEFTIHDKKSYRLLFKNKCPIVLFEPETTQILYGSPAKRRDYIDTLISQIDPQYNKICTTYEKALRQRNSLLKQGISDTSYYFPWDVTLSEYGASIVARRERIIKKINKTLTDVYRDIAKNKDSVSITTDYTEKKYTNKKILDDLTTHFERDRIIKHTTTGPHRHDLTIIINDAPVATTASRGEARTIILALKFIETAIIEEVVRKKPIIILDDVYSELDDTRQKNLITNDNQHIITTTHPIKNLKNAKTITLS